jgi:ion channel-forming bestrophin family protein
MLVNKQISIGYFLNLIKWDVLAITAYSGIAGTLDHFSIFKGLTIPLAVSALIGTLVSLLLAFRTAQSYERWWEARTVWGAIVNDSRTLIRQLIHFLPSNAEKRKYLGEFAVRQSVWCFALTDSLRRTPLSPMVLEYAESHGLHDAHLCNQLLTKHAESLAAIADEVHLDSIKQTQIDSTLARLTDAMGKCERIKNTVFPRSYSVLIHFLIYVLMTILPFGLEDNHPMLEILVVVLVPVLLIAIEKTAIIMQDPFENRPTDTPMTTLSINIEKNLMEMASLPIPERNSNSGSYYQL